MNDTESETEPINLHRAPNQQEPENQHEEDSLYEQKRKLQQNPRQHSTDENILQEAFPDENEPMTGGYQSVLPTTNMISEPSSSKQTPEPRK